MEKLGPLCNLWSMRYESKHRVAKIAARSSANRINTCKSLAIKNQLQLNHLFLENKLPSKFQYSRKIKKVNSSNLTFLLTQFNLSPSTNLYNVFFVTINDITYKPNDVLALHFDPEDGNPVQHLFSNCTFLFETITFDFHVYAYLVEKTDRQHFVSYDSLIFIHPNTISILPPFALQCGIHLIKATIFFLNLKTNVTSLDIFILLKRCIRYIATLSDD